MQNADGQFADGITPSRHRELACRLERIKHARADIQYGKVGSRVQQGSGGKELITSPFVLFFGSLDGLPDGLDRVAHGASFARRLDQSVEDRLKTEPLVRAPRMICGCFFP